MNYVTSETDRVMGLIERSVSSSPTEPLQPPDNLAQVVDPLLDGVREAFAEVDRALRRAEVHHFGVDPYDQAASSCVNPGLECLRADCRHLLRCLRRGSRDGSAPLRRQNPRGRDAFIGDAKSLSGLSNRYLQFTGSGLNLGKASIAGTSCTPKWAARRVPSSRPPPGTRRGALLPRTRVFGLKASRGGSACARALDSGCGGGSLIPQWPLLIRQTLCGRHGPSTSRRTSSLPSRTLRRGLRA